jgi:predicted dehydrogenase
VPGSVELAGTVAGGAGLHLGWHFIPDYPDYRETVTFHHETGSVQLVFSVPYLLNVPTELTVVSRAEGAGDDAVRGEVRATHRWNQHEAFENELIAFHAMVTQGTPAPSGLAQGRADLRVAQRILAALATGGGTAVGGEAGQA